MKVRTKVVVADVKDVEIDAVELINTLIKMEFGNYSNFFVEPDKKTGDLTLFGEAEVSGHNVYFVKEVITSEPADIDLYQSYIKVLNSLK